MNDTISALRTPNDTGRPSYLLLLSLITTIAWATACAPTRTVTHTLTQYQSVSVPAPAAPPLPTPLVDGIGIEGSYTQSFGDETWGGMNSGNLIALGSARLQLSGRLGEAVQLGLGAEYISPAAGQVQVGRVDFEGQDDPIWRVGPAMRFSLFGNEHVELLGHLGVSLARLPFGKRYDYTATLGNGGDRERIIAEDQTWGSGHVNYVFATGGLEAGFLISPAFRLSGGLMLQNYPAFSEFEQRTVTCTYSASTALNDMVLCPELASLDDFENVRSVLIPTASIGAAVNLGPIWVTGQLFAHLGDAAGVTSYAPYGLDMGLRLDF